MRAVSGHLSVELMSCAGVIGLQPLPVFRAKVGDRITIVYHKAPAGRLTASTAGIVSIDGQRIEVVHQGSTVITETGGPFCARGTGSTVACPLVQVIAN